MCETDSDETDFSPDEINLNTRLVQDQYASEENTQLKDKDEEEEEEDQTESEHQNRCGISPDFVIKAPPEKGLKDPGRSGHASGVDDAVAGNIRQCAQFPKVWYVGETCLAKYPGDGKYYTAKIKNIGDKSCSTKLKVSFDGYSSDQDEILSISQLGIKLRDGCDNVDINKQNGRNQLESYWEKQDRYMRRKYEYSDEDSEEQMPGTKSKSVDKRNTVGSYKQRKAIIEDKDSCYNSSAAKIDSPSHSDVDCNERRQPHSRKELSDENIEKPRLEIQPCNEKVPFILCHDKSGIITEVPAVLNQYLREYQREGVKFMYEHLNRGEGCILGDDMGLGKTVQVIALISALLGKTGKIEDTLPHYFKGQKTTDNKKSIGPILIVSPSSVMFNWEDELETWGYFKVAKFHGAAKMEVVEKAKKGKLEIVLTTFETFRNHISVLDEVNWYCMIFDEAHKIKEPNAQVTKAAKAVSCRKRVGLTGTPMQNNMEELWCLLDWANPNCLGQLESFNNKFSIPIKVGQRFNATKSELALARKRQQEFGLLRNKWILRRTKDLLIGQLPRKDERAAFAPLSELQVALYKKILEFPEPSYVRRSEDACECGSAISRSKCCFKLNDEERRKFKKTVFQYLMLLRKVSNHAALLLPFHKASEAQKQMALSVCRQLFPHFPMLREAYEDGSFAKMSDTRFCGKMKVLDNLLHDMEKAKDKVLLFSSSVQLLHILEAYAISRGYTYRRLDGDTKAENRISIVRDFNKDNDVFLFLISTTAGGLGLNLTGANRVIIFDPAWNPSWDSQAQDRAYRVGQHRNVRVYRLISSNSIEENMYLRQIYKQQLSNIAVHTVNERRLFDAVAGCRSMQGELFGIKNLFSLREQGSTLTNQIIERTEEIEALVMERNNEQPSSARQPILERKEVTQDRASGYFNDASSQKIEELESNIENYIENSCILPDNDDVDIDCPPLVWAESASRKGSLENEDVDSPNEVDCKKSVYIQETESSSEESPSSFQMIKKRRKRAKKHISEASQKMDEVLERCGVGYTSTIKSVLKKSAAEDKMTSKAIKDVYWHGLHSQKPANFLEPMSSDESDDIPCTAMAMTETTKQKQETRTESTRKRVFDRIGNDVFLIGESPPAIRKQQFEEIAKDAGFPSGLELAKEMVDWPKDKVTDTLVCFYKKTEPSISKVSSFASIYSNYAVPETEGIPDFSSSKGLNRISNRNRISRTRRASKIDRSDRQTIKPKKGLVKRRNFKRKMKKKRDNKKSAFTKLKVSSEVRRKKEPNSFRTKPSSLKDNFNWDIWSQSDNEDDSPLIPDLSFTDDEFCYNDEVSENRRQTGICIEESPTVIHGTENMESDNENDSPLIPDLSFTDEEFGYNDEVSENRRQTGMCIEETATVIHGTDSMESGSENEESNSKYDIVNVKDNVEPPRSETSRLMNESANFVDYMLANSIENTMNDGIDQLLEAEEAFVMPKIDKPYQQTTRETSEYLEPTRGEFSGTFGGAEIARSISEPSSALDELLSDTVKEESHSKVNTLTKVNNEKMLTEDSYESEIDTSIIDDLMG